MSATTPTPNGDQPMDPDATLALFLAACTHWHDAPDDTGTDERGEARADALGSLANLSEWIERGGFLPRDPRDPREPQPEDQPMHGKLIKRIIQVAHHRNGVGGEPFHVVLFESANGGELMVATVFDHPGAVAVLGVPALSRPDEGVEFGVNSFRGDQYEPELHRAIAQYERGR